MLIDFLGFLLPSRNCCITSFHLTPVFAHEWDGHNQRNVYIRKQPAVPSVHHLRRLRDVLQQHPTIHSLSITPQLRLDFIAACEDDELLRYMRDFLLALNSLKTSTPITLAWPEDPNPHASWHARMYPPSGHWGRQIYLPAEDARNFQLRDFPWQMSTMFMCFFVPFDVQCLHCANYTILRRATKGLAEVSCTSLDRSTTSPQNPSLSGVLMRYWTLHTLCSGWIEFQYDGARKAWSVPQGARRISPREADAHLKSESGLAQCYPPLENPHERLRGVGVKSVFELRAMAPWSMGRWETGFVDEPVRDAFYASVGWRVAEV